MNVTVHGRLDVRMPRDGLYGFHVCIQRSKEGQIALKNKSVLQATKLTNFLGRTHKNIESLWIFRPLALITCLEAPYYQGHIARPC